MMLPTARHRFKRAWLRHMILLPIRQKLSLPAHDVLSKSRFGHVYHFGTDKSSPTHAWFMWLSRDATMRASEIRGRSLVLMAWHVLRRH